MNKFKALLIKEIRELLTPQLLVPLVISFLAFSFIGEVISSESEDLDQTDAIVTVVNRDEGVYAQQLIHILSRTGFEIETVETADPENIETYDFLITLPEGMSDKILADKPAEIDFYTKLTDLSQRNLRKYQQLQSGVNQVNAYFAQEKLEILTDKETAPNLQQPLSINEYVVTSEGSAKIPFLLLQSYLMAQTTFIPVILFLAITFSAQLIITSVASEKENKTLETLLSTPIDRKLIIIAKLSAAGLVAMLFVAIYLLGLRDFMGGFSSGIMEQRQISREVIAGLGLAYSLTDYVWLGVSIFLGILVALAIAFILGALAEDTKKAQVLIAPLMILLLIPYMISVVSDIESLSRPVQILLMIIPFTHVFTVSENLLTNNFTPVIFGNIYLLGFFIVSIYFAAKLFMSESFLTLSSRLNVDLKKLFTDKFKGRS